MDYKFIDERNFKISNDKVVSLMVPLKELILCLRSENIFISKKAIVEIIDAWIRIILLEQIDYEEEKLPFSIFTLVGYNEDLFNVFIKKYSRSDVTDQEESFEASRFYEILTNSDDKEINYFIEEFDRILNDKKVTLLIKEISIFIKDIFTMILKDFTDTKISREFLITLSNGRYISFKPYDLKIIKNPAIVISSTILLDEYKKFITIRPHTFEGDICVNRTDSNIMDELLHEYYEYR